MPQHILLQNYLGPSHYFYDTACSGKPLRRAAAMILGFVTEADFNKLARSNYGAIWFEIEPGDEIRIFISDGDHEEKHHFIVPAEGLPNPPVKLGDERATNRLHIYLAEHCEKIQK